MMYVSLFGGLSFTNLVKCLLSESLYLEVSFIQTQTLLAFQGKMHISMNDRI